jgi:hypothetical protein
MTAANTFFRCLTCGEAQEHAIADGVCPNCGARSVVDLTPAGAVEVLLASTARRPWTHNLANELKLGLGLVVLIVVAAVVWAVLRPHADPEWAEEGPRMLVTPRTQQAELDKWVEFTRRYKTEVVRAAPGLAPCFDRAGPARPSLNEPPYRLAWNWRLDTDRRVHDAHVVGADEPAAVTDCVNAEVANWTVSTPEIPGEADIAVHFQVYRDKGRTHVAAPRWYQVAR